MKAKALIIILVVLAGAVLAGFFLNKIYFAKNISGYLKINGFQIALAENFLISERTDSGVLARKGEEVIKLKIFDSYSAEEAKEFISEQQALLENLYRPQLPPYPEFLTKETGCENKFKPVKSSTDSGIYYLLWSGERFGYGICSDDLIKYKAVLGFFYCERNKKLLKFEYFIPAGQNEEKIKNVADSIKCK